MAFDEKPAINFIDVILYMISCFFVGAFKILSLSLTFEIFAYDVSKCLSLSHLELTELLGYADEHI